jgi:transposase
MAQTVCVILSAWDQKLLEAVVSDRNRQRKHIERAEVVLVSARGDAVQRIAAQLGVSRPMVWRWQQRFAETGVDGLLCDMTRKPGKPIATETVARVVAITCGKPEGEVTQWAGRAMARATGISLTSVQRIWRAHDLKPHRVSSVKRSRDPHFGDKLIDVVGLYLDPPAKAVVLSNDEKSQVQALDRTQLGRPLKSGCCATMTHNWIMHGTTTLFAALNVLDGTVIGRCMQRHRHEEFVRFLRARGSRRQDDRGRGRQLRHSQASEGQSLAGTPSTVDVLFHADLRVMAERSRELLLRAHAKTYQDSSWVSKPRLG